MNNFQIVKVPLMLPASCMACGSTPENRPWFLDLDRDEEMYGALYLCNLCIGSLVDLCGFGSKAKLAGLETRNSELQDEIFQMRLELDGLRKVRDGLSDLGLAFSDGPNGSGDLISVGATSQVAQAAEGGSEEARSGLDSGAGTLDESSEQQDLGTVRPSEQRNADPFNLGI